MPKREIVRPQGQPVPHPTFTPALKYGRWVFLSGVMATDFATGIAPEARGNPNVPLAGEHPMVLESRHILQQLQRLLEACGTSMANAVRIDQFPTSRAMVDPYHIERRDFIKPPRPASTSVVIPGLMVPDCNTEVEIVAICPESGFEKGSVSTDKIPQPIGGYTPAITCGDFIFVSGQVPSDFRTGLAPEARVNPNFWEGNEIDKQARFTLQNLAITLEAAGSSMEHVVKAGVYLTDINDIPRLDRVWREFFPKNPPARTIMPVQCIVVPEGRIEITLVAIKKEGRTKKEVISTSRAPAPLFHESQAVRAGEILFLSGLLAADERGIVPAARRNPHYPYAANRAAAQMEAIMQHAQAICEAAGTDLRHALRLTTMHIDLNEYAHAIGARRPCFPDGQPATTTLQVGGPLQVPECSIAVDLWVGYP